MERYTYVPTVQNFYGCKSFSSMGLRQSSLKWPFDQFIRFYKFYGRQRQTGGHTDRSFELTL